MNGTSLSHTQIHTFLYGVFLALTEEVLMGNSIEDTENPECCEVLHTSV
jgi:hypothetical protein